MMIMYKKRFRSSLKIITLFLIALCSIPVCSQESSDSLLMAAQKTRSAPDLVNLISKAEELSSFNPVMGEQLSKALYSNTKSNGQTGLASESLIWLGNSLINQSKYDSAIAVLTVAQADIEDMRSKEAVAKLYYTKSVAHYYIGEYTNSISLLLLDLEMDAVLKNDLFHSRVLRLIGEVYRAADNLDPALNYLQKALVQAEVAGDSIGLAAAMNRLGVVYYQKGEHEIAEKLLLGSLEKSRNNGFENVVSMNMNDLGELYFATKEFEKSIDLYEIVLQRNSDVDTRINTLNNIARLDAELKKYTESIKMAKEALALAEKVNILTYKVDATKIIADSYQKLNDFVNATSFYNQYINHREQLFEVEKNRQVLELETQYQTQQKELQIANLTEKEAAERERKIYYLVGLIISAAFLAVFILLFNQIRKNNKHIKNQNLKLEELNTTKDKFFSIIAHDLRSPMVALQGIGQKLDYYVRKGKREKLLEIGDKVDGSMDKLNHLLNNLLSWATSQSGGIPHYSKVIDSKEMIGEAIALYQSLAEVKGVCFKLDLEDLPIFVDLNTASTVLRNLISNAVKFTKEGSEIAITTQSRMGYTIIQVQDQGHGIDNETLEHLFQLKKGSELGTIGEKGFGLGLKLCKEFVEINKGTIEVKSTLGKGTVFEVKFPQNEAVAHPLYVA